MKTPDRIVHLTVDHLDRHGKFDSEKSLFDQLEKFLEGEKCMETKRTFFEYKILKTAEFETSFVKSP